MNRTLCILVWTIITYLTSLNMSSYDLGNYTQVVGLILGTSLSAFFIAAFVATEREILKLGLFASAVCLALGGICDPEAYFHFYYNPEKYLLIHQCLAFITIGTVGCMRSLYLYNEAVKLNRKIESVFTIVRRLFEEPAEEA